MLDLISEKLAVRTAVVILAVVTALGLAVIGVAVYSNYHAEQNNQERQLEELLGTVIDTARIAVFLGDAQLAGEIASGLIGHRAVSRVTIRAGGTELASAGSTVGEGDEEEWGLRPRTLTRDIVSPFPPEESIGDITLMSNSRALADSIRNSTFYTVAVQLAELLSIGLCIILVVMRLITRPITTISNRLHNLNISLGEKITFPAGHHRRDEIGQLVHDVNVMIDRVVGLLNTEKALRQELELNERRFRSIFENATSAIFLVDREGRLVSCNNAFLQLFGLDEDETADPRGGLVYPLVGEHADTLRSLIASAFEDHTNGEMEVCIDRVKPLWLKMVLSPGDGDTVQILANEITALKAAVSEVEKKTLVDSLTGLGNRPGIERALAELLDPVRAVSSHTVTLFFLDLDHFKEINDTHGHQAGDAILVNVARVIEGVIRKSDYAARLGGDEFVVLLRDVDEDATAARLATQMLTQLKEPFTVGDDVVVSVGASIGIARGRTGATTPRQLLEAADQAMYRAKQQGRHRYCFFQDDAS